MARREAKCRQEASWPDTSPAVCMGAYAPISYPGAVTTPTSLSLPPSYPAPPRCHHGHLVWTSEVSNWTTMATLIASSGSKVTCENCCPCSCTLLATIGRHLKLLKFMGLTLDWREVCQNIDFIFNDKGKMWDCLAQLIFLVNFWCWNKSSVEL